MTSRLLDHVETAFGLDDAFCRNFQKFIEGDNELVWELMAQAVCQGTRYGFACTLSEIIMAKAETDITLVSFFAVPMMTLAFGDPDSLFPFFWSSSHLDLATSRSIASHCHLEGERFSKFAHVELSRNPSIEVAYISFHFMATRTAVFDLSSPVWLNEPRNALFRDVVLSLAGVSFLEGGLPESLGSDFRSSHFDAIIDGASTGRLCKSLLDSLVSPWFQGRLELPAYCACVLLGRDPDVVFSSLVSALSDDLFRCLEFGQFVQRLQGKATNSRLASKFVTGLSRGHGVRQALGLN